MISAEGLEFKWNSVSHFVSSNRKWNLGSELIQTSVYLETKDENYIENYIIFKRVVSGFVA